MADPVVEADARATAPAQGRLETEEQAINYLEGLLRELRAARDACDRASLIRRTGDLSSQRVFWTFLVKQGQLDGAARALRLAGRLSDRAFTDIHRQCAMLLLPTVGPTLILG